MYPVMLPGNVYEDNGFSSYRNPDGLFPERHGTPPDPLGSRFVRFLERLTDAWDALRRPADVVHGRPERGEPGTALSDPAVPTN